MSRSTAAHRLLERPPDSNRNSAPSAGFGFTVPREAERVSIDRRCSNGKVLPMETPRKPAAKDKDDDEALEFDPTTLPAPVDFHAFARRTGEIIARAARAVLGRRVKR